MSEKLPAPVDTYTFLDDENRLKTIDLVTGEVVSIQDAPVVRELYTTHKGDVLCDLMLEYGSYMGTARAFGIKLGTLNYWRYKHPDFEEKLQAARKLRADYHMERALELAEDAHTNPDKEALPGTKLAIDTHKWAAEKVNPDKYGNKTKITGDATNPVTFVIDTGIRRPDDEPEQIETRTDDIPVEVIEVEEEDSCEPAQHQGEQQIRSEETSSDGENVQE